MFSDFSVFPSEGGYMQLYATVETGLTNSHEIGFSSCDVETGASWGSLSGSWCSSLPGVRFEA